MAKTSAVQWTKPDEVWWSKMAHSDQAMAIEAGRSPSGEEKEYVAAVPSRKKLKKINHVSRYLRNMEWKTSQCKKNKDFGPDICTMSESVYAKGFEGAQDD